MKIHRLSFQLGMINCFAEMVAAGVKRLAISPPLDPEEYEKIREASEAIVSGSGIQSWLERSLIITDLQTPEFTRGKLSILFYRDEDTLLAYQSLKERQQAQVAQGAYVGEARRQISRAFMRLLSYPEDVIEEKIRGGGTTDPFMLDIGEESP